MKQQRNQKKSINFWQMWKDVLIASLSKGQFPVALIGLIILVIIIKMPNEDISKLVFKIIDDIKTNVILSFFISPFLVIGWFFHVRWQRKMYRDEIQRISDARNDIQKHLIGPKMTSSERKGK